MIHSVINTVKVINSKSDVDVNKYSDFRIRIFTDGTKIIYGTK